MMSEYKPKWYYAHQFLFILAAINFYAPNILPYERVHRRAKTQTAGLLIYDKMPAKAPTNKCMLIIPGVTGHSRDGYIMNLADEAYQNGYNVLVMC
jgi:predicted alpha/beta-fold hydrolase